MSTINKTLLINIIKEVLKYKFEVLKQALLRFSLSILHFVHSDCKSRRPVVKFSLVPPGLRSGTSVLRSGTSNLRSGTYNLRTSSSDLRPGTCIVRPATQITRFATFKRNP